MTAALDKTFEILTTSRNEASLPVLLSALDNASGNIYDSALKGLVTRRNKAGHAAVISRWHLLSEEQRGIVSNGRGRMSSALRNAILSEEEQLFQNACEMMVEFREFDLISALITLAEDKSHQHADQATHLVYQMVCQLGDMIHGKRDPNDRRDPATLRSHVMGNLERSVERFRTHQRTELIEAFVVLGGLSCSLLRNILEDPHHVCYLTVVNTLSHSDSQGVIKLLLDFLAFDHTSLAILTVLSRRSDEKFLENLFGFLDNNLTPKVMKNLKRIRSFPWLEAKEFSVSNIPEHSQASCVRLVAASGMEQEKLLGILLQFMKKGYSDARVAVCEALADVPGEKSNQVYIDNMYDEDPQVQAAVARQLRNRHIAGTMAVLVKMLDSPHEVVREAARDSMSEFSFQNYVRQFDNLNDDSRKTTGSLVRKVDLELVPQLVEEFQSQSRRARVRAIEIADTLRVYKEVSNELIELLQDPDHVVRAAAAETLRHCRTPEVQQALQHATRDGSAAVQLAAQTSLESWSGVGAPVST